MIPKRLFVINMVITSIYTIGVLSALYAGLLAPEHSTTAVMASGLINGVATILLAVFVDPKVSVLADDVAKGKRSLRLLKMDIIDDGHIKGRGHASRPARIHPRRLLYRLGDEMDVTHEKAPLQRD